MNEKNVEVQNKREDGVPLEQNTENDSQNTTKVDITQEFRFAVVMYGGISLAIYINGITQELLELVKSTASNGDQSCIDTEKLSPSGKVYRKISKLLGNEIVLRGKEKLEASDIDKFKDEPISSRFIIDILSGTSAGGINAVFLAKALANKQEIKNLKNLWIEEGDIDKLINDSKSVKDLPGIKLKTNSLLNSQRMYLKLLKALDDMGKDKEEAYVKELDLFVTATDLRGEIIPIQLKDKTVPEKLHRKVFHFTFNKSDSDVSTRNDFSDTENPFLAFVARCTSSFPIAFEPMTLRDAINLHPVPEKVVNRWIQRFFTTDIDKSIINNRIKIDEKDRAFGDGGYLDNKPFSYATEALLRRRSDLPIKRHLIYLDPSPNHPELEKDINSSKKPDAIANTFLALSLPRDETIREDIERIINRNKIIRRINRITNNSKLDIDVRFFNEIFNGGKAPECQPGNKSLKDLIKERGISYGTYHRLRIASLTDNLAKLITHVSGFNDSDESAEFLAIRLFLKQWRKENYFKFSDNQEKKTETNFLINFDFDYQLRRLYFIRRKINDLYLLESSAWTVANKNKNMGTNFFENVNDLKSEDKSELRKELRKELSKIKSAFSDAIKTLIELKQCLETSCRNQSKQDLTAFYNGVKDLGIDRDYLGKILAGYSESLERGTLESFFDSGKIKEILDGKNENLQQLAETLKGIYKDCFDKASKQCEDAMNDPEESQSTIIQLARQYVKKFYDSYDYYDMVIFPIIYGTDVGEADVVEIIRISPEDANSLVDEQKESENRRKLAGTSFFAFGGFFDRDWRKNDILWGRLDGAERLISALLPGAYYECIRSSLIEEAHKGIIAEELESDNQKELIKTLLENLKPIQPEKHEEATDLLDKLETYFDKNVIYHLFKTKYKVNHELSPEKLLRYLSRSTQVFGDVLDGISKQKKTNSVVAPWLTRFGRVLWTLVEVASPRPSVFNISIIKYWLPLIYFVEFFLIFSGFVLTQKAVQDLGIMTLVITLIFTLSVVLLKDFMNNKNKICKWTIYVVVFVLTILIVIGVRYLVKYGVGDLIDDLYRTLDGLFLNP
jgi:patatin-related protein